MPLHLIKICVGIDDVAQLAAWQKKRRAQLKAAGKKPLSRHLTRNTPKRADEILDGGSLYWVIKGAIRCRQRIVAIEPARSQDGSPRCALVLGAELVRVVPRGFRAFQGWRYLEAKDAPPDLASLGPGAAELPPKLADELRELGLL